MIPEYTTRGVNCVMILQNVLTTSEAAELWGLGKATIKQACSGQKGIRPLLVLDVECRKSGNAWLVTIAGMERVYGPMKHKPKSVTRKQSGNLIVVELIEALWGFKPDAEVCVYTTLGTKARFGKHRPVVDVRGCAEMDTNKWFPVIYIKEEPDEL